jgi:hypothetical protein
VGFGSSRRGQIQTMPANRAAMASTCQAAGLRRRRLTSLGAGSECTGVWGCARMPPFSIDSRASPASVPASEADVACGTASLFTVGGIAACGA